MIIDNEDQLVLLCHINMAHNSRLISIVSGKHNKKKTPEIFTFMSCQYVH